MAYTHGNNVGIKGIQISEDVDAGVVKGTHAAVMVGVRVDVIDAYGVCPELGHELSIAFALVSVHEGVLRNKLVRNAWGRRVST